MQAAPRKGWRINPFTDCTANTCSGTPEFVATPDTKFANWNPIGDIGGPIFQNRAWFYGGISYDRTDNDRRDHVPQLAGAVCHQGHVELERLPSTTTATSSTQLNNNMRLKVSAALQRNSNRGSIASSLQPDGSFFADGTPTNGFNTATWDATEEAFKDRWENTGSDGRNDLYSANLDWVITPKFFANINTGYWAIDSANPAEFAGDQIIHTFNGTNCDPLGGACPFPETPSSLRRNAGFSRQQVHGAPGAGPLRADAHERELHLVQERLGRRAPVQVRRAVRAAAEQGQLRRAAADDHVVLEPGVRGAGRPDGARSPTATTRCRARASSPTATCTSNNWGFWVQDSWTIRRNFTMNAGIRTENENTPSYRDEFPGIEFGYGEKLAPRVGFAYDIKGDSKWKAYGSFGKYFDITKLEMPRGSFGAEHWIQYFWTLDTLDWTGINCQEGPTGCPGTYIEQNDRRHPANEPDPALAAYFGREQNTIDPDLKPVQTGEITLGLDHELNRTMSVGVRYVHKWLDRTIEDVGVLVPGVGEVFFIANPGEGVAKNILPEPAPALPTAAARLRRPSSSA